MVYLERVQLYNFRNYEDRLFEFSEGLNCIVGKNGSGKTNLLDAVYFLALCKSSIHNQDALSIRFEEDFCVLEGVFSKDSKQENIAINFGKQSKKTVLLDRKAYERLSEHIGKFPVVLVTPNDTDLIRDSAESRRKLFDGLLSQVSEEYLTDYIQYNKALDNRNSLLRQFAEQNYFDADLLKIYSERMLGRAVLLYEARLALISKIIPFFNHYYQLLSDNSEEVSITYVSDLSEPDFEKRFASNLERDRQAQRTLLGIHKDDFVFLMEDQPIKKFGSQGQKKTFVLALKLAQLEVLKVEKGTLPILLLDDIFDKLDDTRIVSLIEIINNLGQVILTDARPERTKELLKKRTVNYIDVEL